MPLNFLLALQKISVRGYCAPSKKSLSGALQLYDHGDPNNKDKLQRDAGWRAVSEAVGITGE